MLSLFNDPRFGGHLDRDANRRKAAKEFLAELLGLKGFDRFDPALPPTQQLPSPQ